MHDLDDDITFVEENHLVQNGITNTHFMTFRQYFKICKILELYKTSELKDKVIEIINSIEISDIPDDWKEQQFFKPKITQVSDDKGNSKNESSFHAISTGEIPTSNETKNSIQQNNNTISVNDEKRIELCYYVHKVG